MNEEQVQQQPTMNNWIDEEIREQEANKPEGTFAEALKFEENKVTSLIVDISKPWDKWIDPQNGFVKKIIPVKYGEEQKSWWINCRNPIYSQLLALAKNAADNNTNNFTVKVLRTGQMKATRYSIVE